MTGSIDAGRLGAWVTAFEEARRGDGSMDVPCGSCTACCRASQFIHVEPDEADALARIPGEVLVPAPGGPPGTQVMGYDEDGCCPMFDGEACSIYEHRPRACRAYDCRVFAAAGLDPGTAHAPVAERVRRWRFTAPDPDDAARHAAIRDTARLLRSRADGFSSPVPTAPVPLALLAIDVHHVVLAARAAGDPDDAALVTALDHALAARTGS